MKFDALTSMDALRARGRRHWRGLTAGGALTAATANVAIAESSFVLLILAMATGGICLAVLVPGWAIGRTAVRHSQQFQRSLTTAQDRPTIGRSPR